MIGIGQWKNVKQMLADMDVVLIEGGRRLGEPIILLPGPQKDPTWEHPTPIFADISTVKSPIDTAFQLILGHLTHPKTI